MTDDEASCACGTHPFWTGHPAKIEAEGVLAQLTGAGEKFWATNRVLSGLGRGQWRIGGRINITPFKRPFISRKPEFTATYELTAEEAALFQRAIGPRFSLNVASWWKGLAGQSYYRPLPQSFMHRLAEAGANVWMIPAGEAGYYYVVYKYNEYEYSSESE